MHKVGCKVKAAGGWEKGNSKTKDSKAIEQREEGGLRKLLVELKLETYQKALEDRKHWNGNKATPELLVLMTNEELTALMTAAGMKPGHRAKLSSHINCLQRELPRFLCDMKVTHMQVAKGTLGLGSDLGATAGTKMAFLGTPVTKGVGMYPKAKGEAKAQFQLPNGTPSGALVGSVALDDSQRGAMLGQGVQFSIMANSMVLWKSKALKSKGSKEDFRFAWTEEKCGNLLSLVVQCKGLNVNAPAIWIDVRILPGESAPPPEFKVAPPVIMPPQPILPQPMPPQPNPTPFPMSQPRWNLQGRNVKEALLQSTHHTNGVLSAMRIRRELENESKRGGNMPVAK